MQSLQIPPVDLRLLTPLLVVVGWASALLLIDVFFVPEGRKKVTGYLAIAGLAVAGLAGIPLWNVSGSTFSGMLVLERYSLALTWIFLIAGVLSIAVALDYLPRHAIEQGEYYPLIMFAVGGMILMAQSADLITLFLGIELLSITLYILTGFAYPRVASEEAGIKYLVLGAFAAGFFVYGIALIFGAAGTTSLAGITDYLGRQPFAPQEETLFLAGASLVLIGFGFKIALVPFHMWTPDVYEGSPTPVAAFMSVGTKGAALAALLRVTLAMEVARDFWLPLLATLAAATMIIGNLGALGQSNLKRMLAYSSIGHAGYILLGIMVAAEQGAQAFLFYMLAYTLTNLGAFGVLIALEQRGEAAWSIDDFAGLYQRRPLLAVAMALFMFSLAGVPPTAGFMGKFFVFTTAYAGGLGWLVLIGVITSAIAAYYYLRVVVKMFMQEPVRDVRPELTRGLNTEILIAGVATLLLGLLPTPIVLLVERSLVALGG